MYAAFLANLSYHYKDYHYQYATECLKRAATVYGQLPDGGDGEADRFFALTELYRATGLSTYRRQIVEYKDFFENNGTYLDEESYYYGSMTYLTTRQKVDRELCEMFVRCIMNRGEEVAKQYQDMDGLLETGSKGRTDLLKRASELSYANLILNNYQYTKIIKNFLHYLTGRNPESVSFYESGGNEVDYMMLLAQLASDLNEKLN